MQMAQPVETWHLKLAIMVIRINRNTLSSAVGSGKPLGANCEVVAGSDR